MSTALPQTNRSSPSGPVSGGYVVMPVRVNDAAPGNATNIYYVTMPFACRVMECSFMADVTATVGTHTWGVQNGGADGTGTTDIVAANSVPASDTVETVAAASLTNRNLVKGDILRVVMTGTNAGDVVTRGVITVTVWVRGHAVALAAND